MMKYTTQEALGELNPVEAKCAPTTLYLEGDANLLRTGLRVCIIGTRHPSERGMLQAQQFARFLVERGVTIVSGLAMGIDTVAHQTAIQCQGRTIAVLGTPLDQVNPKQNTALQREIGEHHLLVTQFAPGTVVTKGNFPQRNRTMALIGNATIIVEAGETSGTLHQGFETLRLGRPLFIVNDVIDSGMAWPKKMLEYGAIPIGPPEEDEATLYASLPLNLKQSAHPAF